MKDSSKQQASIRAAQIALLKEAAVWKDAFSTPDGKKCLELLKGRFYDMPEVAHSNPQVTQQRASQRDLVRFIIQRIEYTGEQDGGRQS